jgi:hypothetical protein
VSPSFARRSLLLPLVVVLLPLLAACPGASDDECLAAANAVSQEASASISGADQSCAVDEDCTLLLSGISCATMGCGEPTPVASVAQLRTRFQAIEADRCPDYFAMGCKPQPPPPCVPWFPACRDGLCDYVDEALR